MANTKFIEAGTAATQGFEFYTGGTAVGSTGAITSDSQAVLGSVRSIKCVTGSGADGSGFCVMNAVMADAGRRFTFGFRYTGTPAPATNGAEFATVVNTGAGQLVFMIGLTSAGKLIVLSDSHANLATGTAILATSTDYRISCAYTITSTTVNTITVRLYDSTNTLLDTITVTNGTLAVASGDAFVFGFRVNGSNAGANLSVWGAHFFIDDGTAGDIGNIRVTAKRTFSNGTAVAFTTQIGAGGSGYGTGHTPQVNERPLSTTNGWSLTNTTKATEEYNIEGLSVGDNDLTGATIIDYTGWLYSQVNSTANSPVHHIIVNGVATTITEATAVGLFTKIAASATYPAGTGTDIGIDAQYTTTGHLTSLFEAGIVVAYTPAVAAAGGYKGSMLSLLGVG